MIENKVANSGLVQLDLESFYPNPNDFVAFDIKDFLFQGLLLKEKDFRESLKNHDWDQYENCIVAIHCSEEDAIIQKWAYMLIASYLENHCKNYFFGTIQEAIDKQIFENIDQFDSSAYQDAMIVLKGCSDKPISDEAYLKISQKLLPVVKTLMFGEPCSTVPIYKRKKIAK